MKNNEMPEKMLHYEHGIGKPIKQSWYIRYDLYTALEQRNARLVEALEVIRDNTFEGYALGIAEKVLDAEREEGQEDG